MLFWLTKNPQNKIKGIIRAGARVNADYLSEKIAEIIRAKLPAVLYININIPKNIKNL